MAHIDEARAIEYVRNITVSYLKRNGVPWQVWDDAIQEAHLKMVVLLPKFDPTLSSLNTYLYVPVIGAVIDLLRRAEHYTRGKNPRTMLSIEDCRERVSSYFLDRVTRCREENPEQRYFMDVEWPEIAAQMLARLEPRERTVVEMLYFRGMCQSEVAAQVGLSQSRVAQLKACAFKHMQEAVAS